jgi:hypothetical protein
MMRSLEDIAGDVPNDTVAPLLVSKDDMIAGLQSGAFAQIAVFEMIGETFQSAMDQYVRQLRIGTSKSISVVVLVEVD